MSGDAISINQIARNLRVKKFWEHNENKNSPKVKNFLEAIIGIL
jgi:hypothetical protein